MFCLTSLAIRPCVHSIDIHIQRSAEVYCVACHCVGMVSKPAHEGQETASTVTYCLAVQHGSGGCGGGCCCCCCRPIRSLCLHDAVNWRSVTATRTIPVHTSNCSAIIVLVASRTCSSRRFVTAELLGCVDGRTSRRKLQ